MANPYQVDVTREAAAKYLAELSGIALPNFAYRGNNVDRNLHGVPAIIRNCTYLNFFCGDEPGKWGEDFKARVIRGYSANNWAKRFKLINNDFLAHKYSARRVYSPLHDSEKPILGGLLLRRFQVLVCCDESELFFLLMLGRISYAVYYPKKNLFVNLNAYMEDNKGILNLLLTWFLNSSREFAAWVMLAKSGRLKRAFIIGDNRPGHYIKESLAYIDRELDALILPFVNKGGLIAIVQDWCFIDSLSIFPELNSASLLFLKSKDAAANLLALALDVHRVYRYATHKDSAWLRHRLERSGVRKKNQQYLLKNDIDASEPDRFRVLISVDSEKNRIANQIEVFQFVLRKLGWACRQINLRLEVIWDGWTVAHEPNQKDIDVIDNIQRVTAEILSGIDYKIFETKIFGLSAEAKIPFVEGCDLVMVTQGTGAVIPCWLLQRPTITYHVTEIVGDRSCLDDDYAYNVSQQAILPESGSDAKVAHQKRFSIALWGVEEALIRAVGNKLPLSQELEWPLTHV